MQHSMQSLEDLLLLCLVAQFLGQAADLCQDIEAALFVYSISL